MKNYSKSTHERESENVLLVEPGIQLKESGIPPTIGIRTKTGIQNPESRIHGMESRIQDFLGFLDVYGAIQWEKKKTEKRRVTFPNRRPA